jgi:hypothetical protein
MVEMVEIMQEMQAKMQILKEIKTEIEKLKNVNIKTTTKNNIKIDCECGCKINKSSWYKHITTKKHLNILNQKSKLEIIPKVKIIPKVEKIQKNKTCLDLYVKPKYERIERLEKVENDDDDDEDYKNEVDNNEVDKVLNKIKERFYKGLYVRNYEHQNYLDISIRNKFIITLIYIKIMN